MTVARTAGAILFVGKRAAERESRAQRREEPLGDVDAAEPLRLAGRVEHGEEPDPPVRAHPRERPRLALEVEKVGGRQVVADALPPGRTRRCGPARRVAEYGSGRSRGRG